jgi:hypothetical protein
MGLLWDSEKLNEQLEQWKEEAPMGDLKYNSYFGDVKMDNMNCFHGTEYKKMK